jgi:hypothetical protein
VWREELARIKIDSTQSDGPKGLQLQIELGSVLVQQHNFSSVTSQDA